MSAPASVGVSHPVAARHAASLVSLASAGRRTRVGIPVAYPRPAQPDMLIVQSTMRATIGQGRATAEDAVLSAGACPFASEHRCRRRRAGFRERRVFVFLDTLAGPTVLVHLAPPPGVLSVLASRDVRRASDAATRTRTAAPELRRAGPALSYGMAYTGCRE